MKYFIFFFALLTSMLLVFNIIMGILDLITTKKAYFTSERIMLFGTALLWTLFYLYS